MTNNEICDKCNFPLNDHDDGECPIMYMGVSIKAPIKDDLMGNLYQCNRCGKLFDKRILTDVISHESCSSRFKEVKDV
jgi:DNA-directed RNA polymerase subunit RPC12/RpoP